MSTVLLCACCASPPDEATARAEFEERRAALDSFENDVFTVLGLTTTVEPQQVAARRSQSRSRCAS